ncbi:serine hydrolase domain-containing protein [Thaumasiovibrio sp. DFM-14]|uniref:serine hydrolase domain-containing protein n=1 Tax=Thaumasiovibrio sp. DFM-14 TaxID=3384792 RepID=UPI00399F2D5C
MKLKAKGTGFQMKLVVALVTAAMGSAVANEQEVYTIPDTLTPVSVWAEGVSAEKMKQLRQDYSALHYASGNDISAFAYLNLPEVITTTTLYRQGPVAEFDQSPMPQIGNTVATTKLGELPLQQAIDDVRSRMQGIAVVHKGELVFEQYPGMQPHQKHGWASTSKTLTGLLINMLSNEGMIDLEKTASDYLPQFKGKPVGEITIANLLHHRSGLDIVETQENIESMQHPLGRSLAVAVSHRGATTSGETIDSVLMDVEYLREDQGLIFDYSTLNTQVLGLIIEEVTGKNWNDVASERIWTKIGMENDGVVGLSAAGDVLNGGVFASTLRDFARFATAFTPSWNAVAQEPVVPENYLTSVYQASDIDVFKAGGQGQRMIGNFGEDSNPLGSSYKWDSVFADGDMYKAGLGGQGIYVSPETDTVVVWFSATYRNSLSMAPYARAIVEQNFR